MRPRTARLLALGLVALAAPLWVDPSAAFAFAAPAPRATQAQVVADGVAYLSLGEGACSVSVSGGSCPITITNKGQKVSTYVATKTSDPDAIVASSSLSDAGSIAVGGSTTLTAVIDPCPGCEGLTKSATWRFEALQGGQPMAARSGYLMSVTFTV